MLKSLLSILLFSTLLYSCKTKSVLLDEWVLEDNASGANDHYKESNTLYHDLKHTELHLSFNWRKSEVIGKATLTLSPYFYSSNELTLDAKNMQIEKVYLGKDSKKTLKYSYNDRQLKISLPKYYKRTETFSLTIEYSAIPGNTIKEKGAAITDSKGLYFINPTNEPNGFMPQIWSQGEPESNSSWFPTIDSPNQKMTQDLFLTVDPKYTTLSNGEHISTTINENGTKTDHWKQTKEAAPYLTMITIGEFSKVKDSWRGIDVDYYLEKKHLNRAEEIFGNTPEMLEFFSNKLGVDYPWEKYAQIIVREYVSGAMENTSAVIFGDFMYAKNNSLGGKFNEDVVSHELFHHWFGDLVTCESWANLPLNESFATYGEYLWKEHKYGRMEADFHLSLDLNNYLRESKVKQEDLIRFDYNSILGMFDSHSYAKGGRVLHMLRNHIGDKAFFQGLQSYLEDNAFQTVEIHDLRIAMEKVSGRDLNWFFNQWFLSSGHPELEVDYSYNGNILKVEIKQKQNLNNTPLYQLPTSVQIYTGNTIRREYITLNGKTSVFKFNMDKKPDFVDLDPDRILLATISDNKNQEMLYQQFVLSSGFQAKYDAFDKLTNTSYPNIEKLIATALNDPYWRFRANALLYLNNRTQNEKSSYKQHVESLIKDEENETVKQLAKAFLQTI